LFEAASVEAPDGVGGADVLRVLIAAMCVVGAVDLFIMSLLSFADIMENPLLLVDDLE